ncbi:TPA: AAA family ATPase [Legionella pneumophila subsp. pneumophila]|uniref:AAA family ATPase n=1 Tax=Legionella pneumophila (strain Lens) TaxID=297245 RepID=Q5WU76_LEGPL|nr:ATP-binding protein [Legionella pneumophila]AOW51142.1 AAA family ATPase [Legionella pneumophila subsp. pneumophila]AOW55256.1 AAA family ATPase [Legionella pneumophila subsp. pneumophila]AOW59192.1 AAA family ATPase [Legionella pneumophila subsp. pneumophila]AOW60619.1 AAA family ATPase [Legionella pneumophila subsp. pneumophila]AOW64649.1 AAA family ATPase [Legionella pneumophila subsp. pneumophila]
MKRTLLKHLENWLISSDRKPLVIRGARQVGKTWLVRHFAEKSGKKLIELNFEKNPSYASLFNPNDPAKILLNLSTISNQKIDPEKCLLFLDEIQASPQLFSKLRWFAEDLPQLSVIAAGSLLEFVLAQHTFSMPVGRISYMHLEPLSFEEFLLANDKQSLYDYLYVYDLKTEVPAAIHENLTSLFKEYILVGGLPAVVSNWIKERSLNQVSQIQNDLLATYRDDFSKYSGRIATERLDEVMSSIPRMLGQKFIFSKVNKTIQSGTIKQILELLEKARISHRVKSCSANGVPLAAEVKEKYFKEIFLDVGLCSTALGLNLNQINSIDEIIMINNGGIAEQIVGQLLRTIDPPYIEPNLYCWHREEVGSSAEIDYVIQYGNKVIPIEVKAGSTGSLKSLHFFMGLKKYPFALRINSDYPNITNVDVKDNLGNPVKYNLISIPFYLVRQIHRLLTYVDLN